MDVFSGDMFENPQKCKKKSRENKSILHIYDEYKPILNSREISISALDRFLLLIQLDTRVNELSKYITLESKRRESNDPFRNRLMDLVNSEESNFSDYADIMNIESEIANDEALVAEKLAKEEINEDVEASKNAENAINVAENEIKESDEAIQEENAKKSEAIVTEKKALDAKEDVVKLSKEQEQILNKELNGGSNCYRGGSNCYRGGSNCYRGGSMNDVTSKKVELTTKCVDILRGIIRNNELDVNDLMYLQMKDDCKSSSQ